MKHPKTTLFAGLFLFAAAHACGEPTTLAAATGPDYERGRYLVERVGMCQDCHSPRDEQGRFLPERWLQGAPLPFQPTVPMPWAGVSKPLAGLPTLTDAQAIRFLTAGELPEGRRVLPPMPEYRFTEADARDIVAYLRHPIAPAAGK